MLTHFRPLGRLVPRGAPAWPQVLSLLSLAAAAFVIVASARMTVLCRTDHPHCRLAPAPSAASALP